MFQTSVMFDIICSNVWNEGDPEKKVKPFMSVKPGVNFNLLWGQGSKYKLQFDQASKKPKVWPVVGEELIGQKDEFQFLMTESGKFYI